jgi:hypothetical protein
MGSRTTLDFDGDRVRDRAVAGAALMGLICFGVRLSASRGLHRGILLTPT